MESSSSDKAPGTEQNPYKLAIIGGGPSGCSVLVRAIRIGYFEKLCSIDTDESLAGVCIIDKCGMDRFGGGTLQDYVINSNTHANKFVTNVLENKPDVVPPESSQGTLLENLKDGEYCQQVEAYGAKQGSLQVIGGFLREVGSAMLSMVQTHAPSSSCRTRTAVEWIQRYTRSTDGLIGWKLQLSNLDNNGVCSAIYAKDVLFATGGRQEVPTWTNTSHQAKVLTSDFVCTDPGIQEMKRRIKKNLRNGGKGKVVIVGGSHSAFSAAWMCLNKMNSNTGASIAPVATTGATATGVTEAEIAGMEASSSSMEEKNNAMSVVAVPSSQASTASSSSCVLPPNTPSVFILHRSFVKVFYSTKREAELDGYTDTGVINKTTGQIHPFGGLRGDAKALWRDIKTSKETRVRLVSIRSGVDISQQTIVTKMFDEAAVIVWACGYVSNRCPVFDADGVTPIPLSICRGQVDVDDQAQILTTKRNLARQSSSSPVKLLPKETSVEKGDAVAAAVAVAVNVASPAESPTNANNSYQLSRPAPLTLLEVVPDPPRSPCSPCSPGILPVLMSAVSPTNTSTSGRTRPSSAAATVTTSTSSLQLSTTVALTASTATINLPGSVPVGGLLGSGLGFGLKAPMEESRADGVAVYLKHAATLVLSHVLGPEVFGGFGITSWEERTAYLRKKESKKEGLLLPLSASRDSAQSAAEGANAGVPITAPRTPSRVGIVSASNPAGSGASVSRGNASVATPGTPQGPTPKKRSGPSASVSTVPEKVVNPSVAPTVVSSSSSPQQRRARSTSVGNINSTLTTNPTVSNSNSRGGTRGASPATKNKIATPKIVVKVSGPSVIPAVDTPVLMHSSSVLLFPPLQSLGVGNGICDHPTMLGLGLDTAESTSLVPLVIPATAVAASTSSLLDLEGECESALEEGQMQRTRPEDGQDECKSATGYGSVSTSSTSSINSVLNGSAQTPSIATTAVFCENNQHVDYLSRSKPEGDTCSRDAKEAENGHCHSGSKSSAKTEATSMSSPPKNEAPSLETQSPNKELRQAIIANAAAAVVNVACIPTSRVDNSRDTPVLPGPHSAAGPIITTAAGTVSAWSANVDEASFRPVSRGLGATAVRASRTAPRRNPAVYASGDGGRLVPSTSVSAESQESRLALTKRFAVKMSDGPCPPHSAGLATAPSSSSGSSSRRTNRRTLPTSAPAPNYLAPIHNNGGGGGSRRIKLRRGSGSYTGTTTSSVLPGVSGIISSHHHHNNNQSVESFSMATAVTRMPIKPHSIALDVNNVNVSSPKGKETNAKSGTAGPGSGSGLGLTRNTFSPVRIGALALGLSTTQALQKFIIKVPVPPASTTTLVTAATSNAGSCPPVILPTATKAATLLKHDEIIESTCAYQGCS